jgi:hypothetical protein
MIVNQSNEVSLTVSKICHEIANYLSVIKFIQEDMKNSDMSEMDELFVNIDMIEHTLKFFRGIYTSFNDDLTLLIKSIYTSKNIQIIDKFNVLNETACTRISNVICGVLYVIVKSCKEHDSVLVTKDDAIIFSASVDRDSFSLPQSVINGLNDTDAEPSAFNIFCKHLKGMANDEGLNLYAKENDAGRLQITLAT